MSSIEYSSTSTSAHTPQKNGKVVGNWWTIQDEAIDHERSRCTAKYNIHEPTYRVKAVFLCFSPSKNPVRPLPSEGARVAMCTAAWTTFM